VSSKERKIHLSQSAGVIVYFETPECVLSLSPKQPVSLRARSHDSTLIGRGKYILPTLLAAAGVPEAGIFGAAAEISYKR
jgi:hypothetical protein